MQPLVSKVPIMMIEGNHEIEEQVEKQTFAAYSARFAFPSEESGSSSTLYYSFNAGGIHFVMLGGYTNYQKSGESKANLFTICLPYLPYICKSNASIGVMKVTPEPVKFNRKETTA